jgi:hypothetical protein
MDKGVKKFFMTLTQSIGVTDYKTVTVSAGLQGDCTHFYDARKGRSTRIQDTGIRPISQTLGDQIKRIFAYLANG